VVSADLVFSSNILQWKKIGKVLSADGRDHAGAIARSGSERRSTCNSAIVAGLDRRMNRRRYASAPTHVVLAAAHDELQGRRISSRINRHGDSNQPAGDFV
jgi:hypothetical protein